MSVPESVPPAIPTCAESLMSISRTGPRWPPANAENREKARKLYMVFLQTQVRSGHSLCLSRVGSSVPRTRPPPRVACKDHKDPRLSVPDCPSLSLNPSLPSLWYPAHTHVPTMGLWTQRFLPSGLCTCQVSSSWKAFYPLCA